MRMARGDWRALVVAAVAALAACGDDVRPASVPVPVPVPVPVSCDAGFMKVGNACVDVDECTLDRDNCDVRAACSNTPGTFTCTCEDGWSGDGTQCEPTPCRFRYTAGHGDMYASWDPATGLAMSLRSELEPGMGERAYAPSEVCIDVPRSTYDEVVNLGGRPSGAGWDPIGVAEGEAFWFLSETPIDGTPWFGIASDLSPAGGVPIGVLDDYLTLSLAVTPPADAALSVWGSVSDPEAPPFLFSTAHRLLETQIITGSHGHVSWAFTRPGEYRVEAVIEGTRLDTGASVSSLPVTYRFVVAP